MKQERNSPPQGIPESVDILVNEYSGCLDTNAWTKRCSRACDHFDIHKFSDPEEEDFLILGSAFRAWIGSRQETGPEPPDLVGAPIPNGDDNKDSSESAQHEDRVPESYTEQQHDWFRPGRYLRLWAEAHGGMERDLHLKEFILLDTSNLEGKGIRVDRIGKAKLSAGASRYSVAITERGRPASNPYIGHGRPTSEPSTDLRFTKIFLNEVGGDGPTDRYVRLDHTYNIPFMKYPCQDLGMLEPDSLDQLRIRFIEYMAVDWRLVHQLKSLWDSRQAGRPRGAS